MRFVVDERVGVADNAGDRVVGGDVERAAQRRGEGARGEHAVGDEGRAADGERGDAVGRTDGERARLGEAFLREIRAIGFADAATGEQIIFVHRHVAAVGGRREVGDVGWCVADGDRERGGVGIAIAVAQRVGEHLVHTARGARVAGVAVGAVGVERERSILACECEVAGAIGRGVRAGGHVDARHAEHRRAVRALRVCTAVEFGVGDHVARRRAESARGNRVGVVHCIGAVIFKRDGIADILSISRCVTIAVCECHGNVQRVGGRRYAVIGCVGCRILMEREILLDGELARNAVDGGGEGRLTGKRAAVHGAHDHAAGELCERDVRAVGHGKARVAAVTHGERIDLRSA